MEVNYSEPTGIYQRRTVKLNTANAFREFVEWYNYGTRYRLDVAEEACEAILASPKPGLHIENAPCRGEFIRDVESARMSCRSIRHLLAEGDAEAAINEAIALGMAVERANVRAHERNALAGNKVRAGGRKGRAEIEPRYARIHERDAKIRMECVACRNDNPQRMQSWIDENVGKRHGLKGRQVRRIRSKKFD